MRPDFFGRVPKRQEESLITALIMLLGKYNCDKKLIMALIYILS